MLSTAFWAAYWWWWLVAIAASWLIMELASIAAADLAGAKPLEQWTLSDAIRRWSAKYRWLAPVVVGVMAMLAWHWFAQANP